MITSRLTREQWGAASIGRKPTRVSSMRGIAVHWVGPGVWGAAGIGDHSKCAGKIRGIQRAHMAGEYYDIAYSEGVCPHGQRFELRGHNVQVGANGSSFANANWYAVLALVGVGDQITPELLRGIGLAIADYRRNAAAGDDITAHRVLLKQYAGRSTTCCGDELYGHVVKGTFATPSPEEDDMPSTAEIVDAIFNTNTLDEKGDPIRVGTAIGRTYRNGVAALLTTRDAARDAAAALAVAKAQALEGRPLTADEVKAVVAEVLDAKIDDATVVFGVKAGE